MPESIQHKLDRVRPPRVQITYDVETLGSIVKTELPFVVGIMADLSGYDKKLRRMPDAKRPPLKDRKFVEIDRDNFNEIMERLAPKVTAGGVELEFKTLEDFNPINVLRSVPALRSKFESRTRLSNLLAKLDGNPALQKSHVEAIKNLSANSDDRQALQAYIEVILHDQAGQGEAAAPFDADALMKLIPNTQVPDNEELRNWLEKHPEEIIGLLVHRIAQLDEEINEHLSNEVMHDPNFQTLEATWRGLHYLVSHTETGDKLKLRILDATKDEIRDDLAKAIEFDQSVLFKKIYEEEYGTFGGSPYSMLLADYFFEGTQPDLDFLERMSGVAAAAHAPFIAAAAPGLFDLETFAGLNNPRDLTKIFGSTLFAKWNAFRDSEDSRYVALCLPRFLLRPPYGTDDYKKVNKETGEYDMDDKTKEPKKESLVGRAPADEINFQERMSRNGDKENPPDNKFLWGNAAYLMTERITNAFSHYKWPAAISGVGGGGLVEGLPAINFQTNEGDVAFKCPVEVSITDRREKELSDLGFISLVHLDNTDVVFFGVQTTQKPKLYMDPNATANARLSCSLHYILAASRFAHYIKVIMRDKVGSFQSRENVEKFLNSWISNYVLLNDDASQTAKASYPLREARVDVTDIPGKPGCYNATIYLRPHFQFEEVTASIRLVAELPLPAAA